MFTWVFIDLLFSTKLTKFVKKIISMKGIRSAIREGRFHSQKAQSLLPWRWQWTRKSLVLATTLVTVVVFGLDMFFLNDWAAPSSLHDWITGDGGLLFYLLGFGSAYAFLQLGRPRPKQPPSKGSPASGRTNANQSRQAASMRKEQRNTNAKPALREGALCKATASGGLSMNAADLEIETRAIDVFSAPASSAARVNHAITQAAARFGAEKAGDILAGMESEGLESDATSYNLVIRAYAKNGDLSNASRWFKKMSERGLEPNEYSYNTLMNAHAKADDVSGVEAWMDHMTQNNVVATGISYAIVIHASARRGDVVSAERWLERMIEAGLTPDCVNYNSLIHACSVRKDSEGAERWFEKLMASGQEPTVMTYTALVDACSKSLDVKKAERWMSQLLELGLEPNVVSFSAMVDACARVGDIERAERWYTKMLEYKVLPNAYIFSALINACARASDVEAACAWLKRAESSGAALDAVVYGCVINACGKAGDSKSAMTAFRQMRAQGIRTHIVVYGALARPFAYAGDWEEVERIQEEMAKDGIAMNDYFLYSVLLAYSRAKPRRGDRAEAAFYKAMSDGVQPNERIVKALSSAVGRARCTQILNGLGLHDPALRGALVGGGADPPARRSSRTHTACD